MDFILETVLRKNGIELKDNFFIFPECYESIKNKGWENFWEDVKATYRTIQTWYNDRKLYHYIGFLMNVKSEKSEKKVTLGKLLQDYNKLDKKTFLKTVKSECRELLLNKKSFSELKYGSDNKALHDILLAFNLATIQNQTSETSRYPFNIHSEMEGNSWSLEHIHAQKERTKNWTTEEFEKDDSLMNLALLQSNKNAALNNKTFPEKRENLAKYENAEQETQFIPICTRNVFFKHYSPDATNPFIWDRKAGEDYVKAIIKVVGKFVDAESYYNFDPHGSEIEYGLKNKKEEV